jgi:hypothetical protein
MSRKLNTICNMDGGGEYKSNELKNYCDNNGITHQMITTYIPQQNGCYQIKELNINQKCSLYDAICGCLQKVLG